MNIRKRWKNKSNPIKDILQFQKDCIKKANSPRALPKIIVSPEINKLLTEDRKLNPYTEYPFILACTYVRKFKRVAKKAMIFFYKLIRKLGCLLHDHNYVKITRWNGIETVYCSNCKKVEPELAGLGYGVRCLVGGKYRNLPLIKMNIKTVKVGIDNKTIDRHFIKHDARFIRIPTVAQIMEGMPA
jgi:hypothetical protein